jgi:hypothetical protein
MSEAAECPVCYMGIDATTDSATTSCEHKFHIKCIATWYITNHSAKCPCCRANATDLEKPEKPAPITNKDYVAMGTTSLIDSFLADTIIPNNEVVNATNVLQEWYNLNTIGIQGTNMQNINAQTIIYEDNIIHW